MKISQLFGARTSLTKVRKFLPLQLKNPSKIFLGTSVTAGTILADLQKVSENANPFINSIAYAFP